MASNDSPEIMRRTKGVYFNEEKLERFHRVRGKTFLIRQVDPTGTEYHQKFTVPDKETAFAREAVDRLLDVLEASQEVKEASNVLK